MNVDPERVKHGYWWDKAWSLVDGCTAVSSGCAKCWAKSLYERFHGKTFDNVTPREDRLLTPIRRGIPTVYAVWNDLFHERVPENFIIRAFKVMWLAGHHRFVVLTKRVTRMHDYFIRRIPLTNVCIGVSAEDEKTALDRTWFLEQLASACRVMSYEPALGPIDGAVDFRLLNWFIIGPETGAGRRPCEVGWIRDVARQAQRAGVPVFIKALPIGKRISKDMGEWPEDLRLREFPEI
jgi:protein gp37